MTIEFPRIKLGTRTKSYRTNRGTRLYLESPDTQTATEPMISCPTHKPHPRRFSHSPGMHKIPLLSQRPIAPLAVFGRFSFELACENSATKSSNAIQNLLDLGPSSASRPLVEAAVSPPNSPPSRPDLRSVSIDGYRFHNPLVLDQSPFHSPISHGQSSFAD